MSHDKDEGSKPQERHSVSLTVDVAAAAPSPAATATSTMKFSNTSTNGFIAILVRDGGGWKTGQEGVEEEVMTLQLATFLLACSRSLIHQHHHRGDLEEPVSFLAKTEKKFYCLLPDPTPAASTRTCS